MITLYQFNGSCDVVRDLFTKICVPSETEVVDVELFNIITGIYEVKTLRNKFHVIINAN